MESMLVKVVLVELFLKIYLELVQEVLMMLVIQLPLKLQKNVFNSVMIPQDVMPIPGTTHQHRLLTALFCMHHVMKRFHVMAVLQVESTVNPLHNVSNTKYLMKNLEQLQIIILNVVSLVTYIFITKQVLNILVAEGKQMDNSALQNPLVQ